MAEQDGWIHPARLQATAIVGRNSRAAHQDNGNGRADPTQAIAVDGREVIVGDAYEAPQQDEQATDEHARSECGDPEPPVADLTPDEPPWPDPPAEEAFHGLAGRIVRTIEPASEADPAALLVQTLVAFGNVIGKAAWFTVEGDRHHGNEFVVLVGQTSKAQGHQLGPGQPGFHSGGGAVGRRARADGAFLRRRFDLGGKRPDHQAGGRQGAQ